MLPLPLYEAKGFKGLFTVYGLRGKDKDVLIRLAKTLQLMKAPAKHDEYNNNKNCETWQFQMGKAWWWFQQWWWFLLETVFFVDAVPDLPSFWAFVACEALWVQKQIHVLGVRTLLIWESRGRAQSHRKIICFWHFPLYPTFTYSAYLYIPPPPHTHTHVISLFMICFPIFKRLFSSSSFWKVDLALPFEKATQRKAVYNPPQVFYRRPRRSSPPRRRACPTPRRLVWSYRYVREEEKDTRQGQFFCLQACHRVVLLINSTRSLLWHVSETDLREPSTAPSCRVCSQSWRWLLASAVYCTYRQGGEKRLVALTGCPVIFLPCL